MLDNARRRAREEDLDFDLTPSDLVIPDVCPVLGLPLAVNTDGYAQDNSPTLDRVRPHGGYVRGNVMIISGKANRIKSNATAQEILAVGRWLSQLTEPSS